MCEIYLVPGTEQEPEENACVSQALNNRRGGAACSSFWWQNQSSLPTLVQSLPRSMQRLPLAGRGWNPWIQISIALQEVHNFMPWMQCKQWNKNHYQSLETVASFLMQQQLAILESFKHCLDAFLLYFTLVFILSECNSVTVAFGSYWRARI